jgi:hypothetical protein
MARSWKREVKGHDIGPPPAHARVRANPPINFLINKLIAIIGEICPCGELYNAAIRSGKDHMGREHDEAYEAIGSLIYRYHRHQELVSRMCGLLGVPMGGEVPLAERLAAIETHLDALELMPDECQAVLGFVQQMRAAGQLIERPGALQSAGAGACTRQLKLLESAAQTAWSRMLAAVHARNRQL